MIVPNREEIIKLNQYHINKTGGFFKSPDNLLNRNSLEWVLNAVQFPLFGLDPYPTIAAKASLLTWVIISRHVFYDGNKRTGISALQIFLLVNGYKINATYKEYEDIALAIARGKEEKYPWEYLLNWVEKRSELIF